MSYRHINLEKIKSNDNCIRYRMYCPDFNDSSQLEDFGVIEIDKEKRTFIHKNNELWVKNKIYPIELFKLSPQEREKEIISNFNEYGSASWPMSVFNFIEKCLNTNCFPEKKDLYG